MYFLPLVNLTPGSCCGLTSAQRGHVERRRADLCVRPLSGHGRLHLHVAALWGAERGSGQVLDGGVRVLAVQRAAARSRQLLQLCSAATRRHIKQSVSSWEVKGQTLNIKTSDCSTSRKLSRGVQPTSCWRFLNGDGFFYLDF